ncbi:MAG: MFS transporter [Candidatus Hermodarchaeota archaeon]
MKTLRQSPLLSLFFLFSLILLNGMGVTLPIPNLARLAEFYNFPLMGLVEAMFVIVSTFFLLIWGYNVDKLKRKPLIWGATIIWSFPTLIIFLFPNSLLVYVLGRFGMAIGLSAFSPLSYSILADFARYEDRGLISSGLNLAWIGSSAGGILIGGIFAEEWRLSFGFLALLGFVILFWQVFIEIPTRGKQEPMFNQIKEYEYTWRIEFNQIPAILKSRTIFWLLIQGTFALIPGTIFTYWLVSFLSSSRGISLNVGSASVVAIIVASGRVIGYPFLGKLGDFYAKKYESSLPRARIASICMGSQALFFFLAFITIDSSLVSFIGFSLLFWIGSFIGGGSGPNRTSLLYDVSLPEHRGSLGALFSLTDHFGEIIGIVFSTLLLQHIGFREVFSLSLVFYLIAALAWSLSFPYIQEERLNIQNIMSSRASEMIQDELKV